MIIITSIVAYLIQINSSKSSESFTQYGEDKSEVLIQHFGDAYLDQMP